MMKKYFAAFLVALGAISFAGCSTSYKAKPLPFKAPAAYGNVIEAGGAQVAAKAFVDGKEARKAFGFDIRGAGMLPVQVVFDHQGKSPLSINPEQTFLEDDQGNLWPILNEKIAYERASKYSQTKNIVKKGAYSGMLGAVAGSIIGAAVGIVNDNNILEAAGKGAAVGAAAGATRGGASGYGTAGGARREIIHDLQAKSLRNRDIAPGAMARGIIFFPGEAKSAKILRLQLVEKETGKNISLRLFL